MMNQSKNGAGPGGPPNGKAIAAANMGSLFQTGNGVGASLFMDTDGLPAKQNMVNSSIIPIAQNLSVTSNPSPLMANPSTKSGTIKVVLNQNGTKEMIRDVPLYFHSGDS